MRARLLSAALGQLPGLLLLVSLAYAQGTTITVDTNEDNTFGNGNCSLREAILAINTNAAVDACPAGTAGTDVIGFKIGGGGSVQTIDGFVQGCADGPCIELDGNGTAKGLVIGGGASTVRGLILNRFTEAAIHLVSDGNRVESNYIGTGTADRANTVGILIESSGNTVGGTTMGARNVISGNLRATPGLTGSGVTIRGVGGRRNRWRALALISQSLLTWTAQKHARHSISDKRARTQNGGRD